MDFDSFVLSAATGDIYDEPAARAHADILEYRMDLAADPIDKLDEYDGELPLLVTNRVEWEGGDAPDTAARLDALETAVEYNAVEAVDVELGALVGEGKYNADRVVEAARGLDTAVIVSAHDFQQTPKREKIEEWLTRACKHGDVGKVATTAAGPADVLALLNATHEKTRRGRTVATMAMGEAGRHSRAVAPLYGSKIGYAPVRPENATAPGQYDLETLRELIDQLKSRQ
jgi:3-dehydroquinate dehydratase-1